MRSGGKESDTPLNRLLARRVRFHYRVDFAPDYRKDHHLFSRSLTGTVYDAREKAVAAARDYPRRFAAQNRTSPDKVPPVAVAYTPRRTIYINCNPDLPIDAYHPFAIHEEAGASGLPKFPPPDNSPHPTKRNKID